MGHYAAWTCGECRSYGTPQCPLLPEVKFYSTPDAKCWKRPTVVYEGWGPETEESGYSTIKKRS